jgi:putative hydrolase of the HAD superfamily
LRSTDKTSDRTRAIVFDAVGTLIHPEPSAPEIYHRIGRLHGSRRTLEEIAWRFREAFEAEEEVDRRNGHVTSEAREVERWRKIVTSVLDDVVDAEKCFRALYEHFGEGRTWRCGPAGKALEVLRKRGYKLAIASNYDHRLRRVLAALEEAIPIQDIVISAEIGWRKPAREFFLAVAKRLGLPAQEVLHVGDDEENDYMGARSAGFHAILLPQRATADVWESFCARFE